MEEHQVLGIDIGGTGIKGAIVDVHSGQLLTERIKILTPHPATPEAIAGVLQEQAERHNWSGLIGCGFPAVIKKGIAYTASNIDKRCIGVNFEVLFSEISGCPVKVVNDADAAGIAEMQFGMGKGRNGVVLLITIGSGIGTALFLDGRLVPNTEFGHVFLHNQIAEHYASNNARLKQDLSWEEWGKRFNEYLHHMDRLLSPDLIILGGGVSNDFRKYASYFDVDMEIRPAQLFNAAGTVGAACYAYQMVHQL